MSTVHYPSQGHKYDKEYVDKTYFKADRLNGGPTWAGLHATTMMGEDPDEVTKSYYYFLGEEADSL